ncbi:MAG: YCF48-related protein [Bacteroidales bacterium]
MKTKPLLVLSFFLYNILLGQSPEFFWSNPRPQGNDLKSTYFINNTTGWCVGNAGTLLKTTDGGNSWTTIFTGTGKTLYDICLIDDIGWIVGGNYGSLENPGGIILKSTNGGQNWIIYATDTLSILNKIQHSDNCAWIIGKEGSVYKSNKGSDWNKQSFPIFSDLLDLHFINDSTGWITSIDNQIHFTNDGGGIWQNQESNYLGALYSIYFMSESQGWISTDGIGCTGGILRTLDGGLNWNYISYNNAIGTGLDIYFCSPNHGFNVGLKGSNGVVLETFDGGLTWIPHYSNNCTSYNSIFFSDIETAYIVGNGGVILKTNNEGNNWIKLSQGNTAILKDVFFVNEMNGWVLNRDSVMLTNDGGISWNRRFLGSDNFYNAIFFINNLTGWAVGTNGAISKTIDGGLNWQYQEYLSNVNYNNVYFKNEYEGWLVASFYPLFLKTDNGGETWDFVYEFWGTVEDSHFLNEYEGLVVTSNSMYKWSLIYKTNDGGNNWMVIDTVIGQKIKGFSFINEYEGYMVSNSYNDDSQALHYTSDGGIIWELVETFNKGYKFISVYFLNSQQGWIGTEKGICYTDDGGKTITRFTEITDNPIYDFFQSGDNMWAVGNNGTILKCYNPISNFEKIPVIYDGVKCFPNPASEKIIVEIVAPSSFNIYSISGRLYKTGELTKGNNILDISFLIDGIYIIEFRGINESVKIIKQN